MKAKKDLIKLVVINENILGYIQPETPNYCQILHASFLKGAHIGNAHQVCINFTDVVRLASEQDFDTFNVMFDGYKLGGYEYAIYDDTDDKIILTFNAFGCENGINKESTKVMFKSILDAHDEWDFVISYSNGGDVYDTDIFKMKYLATKGVKIGSEYTMFPQFPKDIWLDADTLHYNIVSFLSEHPTYFE